MDVNQAIKNAVKTGKVSFGAKSAIQNAKTGKVKLIIVAFNCPKIIKDEIEYYCKLSKFPLITYKGTSMDLAALCDKPFIISAISIREPGDSEILKITENVELESKRGNK